MIQAIIEQLTDFCDCLPDELTEEGAEELIARNIKEMIQLVSILTCWTNEPCETLLNSERREVIDVNAINPCDCKGGVMDFVPFYSPFDAGSFKVYLATLNGVHEEIEELDADSYSFVSSFNVLKIDVAKYIKQDLCSCCPPQRKLVIAYDAGYDLLPDCLLPLFCDLLHVIYDKNKCDCKACVACDKGNTEGEIDYNDEVSPKIGDYLNSLIKNIYTDQLGIVSLCGCDKPLWGIVT